MKSHAINAQKLDECFFGLRWLPAVARKSAAWCEWTNMIRSIEDADDGFEFTDDDLPALLEVYAALRRLGAVFDTRLTERFDAWHGAMLMNEDDGEPRFPECSARPAIVHPMSDERAKRLGLRGVA